MPSLDDFPDAPRPDLPKFDSNGLLPDGDYAPDRQLFEDRFVSTGIVVTISWSAVAGAANYEIQRSTNINNGFTTLTTVATLNANDSSLTADTTYLYKVRAINGATMSAFSSIDPATTTIFMDDPLNVGVPAKAVHITQLRTAVNAMRAAANLGAQSFTDPGLAAGVVIKAVHQNDLRAALNQARTAIGLSAIVYTDPPTVTGGVTTIKAAHIVNLRDGVK
jgi:hypothetical protein